MWPEHGEGKTNARNVSFHLGRDLGTFHMPNRMLQAAVHSPSNRYGPRVFHIHLTASEGELTRRYARRKGNVDRELFSYSAVRKSRTEKRINSLEDLADVVIATDRSGEADVLVCAASYLGLYGREQDQLVDVVVGGQFGSEGIREVSPRSAKWGITRMINARG